MSAEVAVLKISDSETDAGTVQHVPQDAVVTGFVLDEMLTIPGDHTDP